MIPIKSQTCSIITVAILLTCCSGCQETAKISSESPDTLQPKVTQVPWPAAVGPLRIVVFGTPYCETCRDVDQFLPSVKEQWGERVAIEKINVATPDGAKLFDSYMKQYNTRGLPIPTVFVGRKYLIGSRMIIDDLNKTIRDQLSRKNATFAAPTPQARLPDDSAKVQPLLTVQMNVLRLVYFHSPWCESCRRVETFLLSQSPSWGNRVTIERHDISQMEGLDLFLAYCQKYNIAEATVPVLFVGQKVLVGEQAILQRTEDVVSEQLCKQAPTYKLTTLDTPDGTVSLGESDVSDRIMTWFNDFSAPAIATAGLIDGINPCAFTTIVFFLAMLTHLGKSKGQLLMVGAGFTLAIFATYFLLGLGLLGAIKTYAVRFGVSAALAYLVVALAFALAVWSLVDFVRYVRTHDVHTVTLTLPNSIKTRIHKVIHLGLGAGSLLAGSIFIGILVALLESLCTGQAYLPTIVLLTRVESLRTRAIGYLLLYNVMFIVPLILVLIISYFGVRSERLRLFALKHLAATKLAMALLFAFLGVIVLITVI